MYWKMNWKLFLILVVIGPIIAAIGVYVWASTGCTGDKCLWAVVALFFFGAISFGFGLGVFTVITLASAAYRFSRVRGVSLGLPTLLGAVAAVVPPAIVAVFALPSVSAAPPKLALVLAYMVTLAVLALGVTAYIRWRHQPLGLLAPIVALAVAAGLLVGVPEVFWGYGDVSEKVWHEDYQKRVSAQAAAEKAAQELVAGWEGEGCKVWRDHRVEGLWVDALKRVWANIDRGQGLEFVRWDRGTLVSAAKVAVQHVAADGKGRLWLISDRGLIVTRDQPPFDELSIPNPRGLPKPFAPKRIAGDGRGKVAIAYSQTAAYETIQVAILENEVWTRTPPLSNYSITILGFTFDTSGHLWVMYWGEPGGLVRLEEKGWVYIDYDTYLPEVYMESLDTPMIYRVRNSEFWAHTSAGLRPIAAERKNMDRVRRVLAGNKYGFMAAVVDAAERVSRIFLSTHVGLVLISNGRIVYYPFLHGGALAFDEESTLLITVGQVLLSCPVGAGPNK